MKFLSLFLILVFCLTPTFAWNNHAGLTYLILESDPQFIKDHKVKVEPLSNLLSAESDSLFPVWLDSESWAERNLPHWKPNASEFRLQRGAKVSVDQFWKAYRLNPKHKVSLYLQKVELRNPKPELLSELTILSDVGKLPYETFIFLKEGESVSAREVLFTAVDEPDYDLDLYLFEDSGSEVGSLYGFGSLPFGNPKYEYSSQAPFHMGFYHEPGILFSLAGFLKQTYPEMRIHQFTELSKWAFSRGHSYWGYRFAGWALHYIQDLTQPYHSSVLPRVSVTKQIGVQVLATLGITGPKNRMIDFVTERHTLIEEYQYHLIRSLVETRDKSHPVALALQNVSSIEPWEGYASIRTKITKEAYEFAPASDEGLESLGIQAYEKLYEREHPIHNILGNLLHNTAKHTRGYLKQTIP